MKKSVQEKYERLQGLMEQKADIERQIEAILMPETVVALPPDFSINDEVYKIIRDNPNGIHAKKILTIVQEKYPSYNIDRKRVNGALVYMKNRKETIEIVQRGVYKVKDSEVNIPF